NSGVVAERQRRLTVYEDQVGSTPIHFAKSFLRESEDTTMANKTLFASLRDALIPQTNTVNSENAPAYALAPKQALAQYAATGCFGRTFYATVDEQLTRVLELCDSVDPEFVAHVAIYSRTQSFMKDM